MAKYKIYNSLRSSGGISVIKGLKKVDVSGRVREKETYCRVEEAAELNDLIGKTEILLSLSSDPLEVHWIADEYDNILWIMTVGEVIGYNQDDI